MPQRHFFAPTAARDDGPPFRVYFAALPPAGIARQIREVWTTLGSGERFWGHKLHLTIAPVAIGETFPEKAVNIARQAMSGFSFASITLCLDRLMVFGGGVNDRALVLGMGDTPEGMGFLQAAIEARLARVMPRPKPAKLSPHVTCAYGRSFGDERPLPNSVVWQLDRLALVVNDKNAANLQILGDWPMPVPFAHWDSCRGCPE